MGTTALMIRGESADEMLKLVQLDRLMSLAIAIADSTVRSDIELFCETAFHEEKIWYDRNRPARSCEGDEELQRARQAYDYIQARGADAFPWEVVAYKETGLIRFVNKAPLKEVASG